MTSITKAAAMPAPRGRTTIRAAAGRTRLRQASPKDEQESGNVRRPTRLVQHRFTTPKEVPMRRIQLLVAMVLSGMLLAACHTTAGAGRDISAAGNAITHSAT